MLTFTIAMLLAAPILMLRLDGSSFKQPLKPDEERECLRRLAEGDEEARLTLIERNMRLVAHIVKKYYANETDREDLIQIGAIGLINAIGTYKPDKKVALSTYASTCIENEIRMHFRRGRKRQGDQSLDEPLDNDRDGNPLTLGELLMHYDNTDEKITAEESRERLLRYLREELNPTELKILIARYGIGGAPEQTQREVAADLGISRSYVSRIESRAVGKLRERFASEDDVN
ncbi:MAG: sigma-70 family RNA polymerase sigma factor [Oscillospiraceae bacterium]|jgi:RNA polymerase sporulation-specific sigma factor|nr:sigma-70 family RNA polymerase sigma factor [Oscillospiraceae bacterium]